MTEVPDEKELPGTPGCAEELGIMLMVKCLVVSVDQWRMGPHPLMASICAPTITSLAPF